MGPAATTIRLSDDDLAKAKFTADKEKMTLNGLIRAALSEYIESKFSNGLVVVNGVAYERFDTAGYDFDEYIQAALLIGDKQKAIAFTVLHSENIISHGYWDDDKADNFRKAYPENSKLNKKTVEAINVAWPNTNLQDDADVLDRMKAVFSKSP